MTVLPHTIVDAGPGGGSGAGSGAGPATPRRLAATTTGSDRVFAYVTAVYDAAETYDSRVKP